MSIAKSSVKGLREAAVIFFIGEIGYSLWKFSGEAIPTGLWP